ncbi:hypothetical protein N9A28_00690 [Sulfurimonas sp.]|nr:hypothetical protein [Sulfurimonas sp.]
MENIKQTNFDEAIISIKILDESTLLVVDSKTSVRYLDKDTLKVKSGFKVNISHDRFETTLVDFTLNADSFVVLSEDLKESRLYNTKSKKMISKMDRHQGVISCVSIDPKNRYSLSGGEDGKIFGVDIRSGQHSFNLPSHADTINDIVFSRNGLLVATAGYDKKISVFSLAVMKQKHKLRSHMAPIIKLLFIDNNRLFSIDKRGVGIVWNIEEGRVIKRLDGIHDDVTEVVTSSDGHFLFIGTKLGYVIVFDLNSYELVDKRYVKLNSPITAMNFDEGTNSLIVATQLGEILFYEIYSGQERIIKLIKEKKYTDVEEYVSLNPLLKYTDSYKTITQVWDTTVLKAIELLGRNDKANAIKLFHNFIAIPIKKQQMNKLIKEYEEFEKLIDYVKAGKLALAYGLINKHPSYKESSVYTSMQKEWKKAFQAAQKYLLEPRGYDKAKEILAPYRGISDKTVHIQSLMLNADVHKRFKLAIGTKDFKLCYELIKQHPFLTEYNEYDTLAKYASTLYTNIQTFILEGNTHSAIKLIDILSDFDDYKNDATAMLKEVEDKQKFFNAIENSDMISAYNFLDSHDSLQLSEDGKRLQNLWDKDIVIADEYASKGDMESLRDIFHKYMKIESKYIAISTIVSWCYISQLQNAIIENKSQSSIENGIKNYVLYFGLTEQIFSFYKTFISQNKTSKLTLDSLAEGSLDKWKPSMIVNSILD